jgi:3-hexulose-6-phosphate synthase
MIQLALDLTSLDKAMEIASKVYEYVDYIEAGTPLVKVEGLKAVSRFKEEFSEKIVVADLKTMDTGFLEASLAYEYGADYSTVMGVADIGTIKGAIDARDRFKRGLMIDLMGLTDVDRILELDRLNPDYLIVHSGIDMQLRGVTPFKYIKDLLSIGIKSKIAVAGGLNKDNIVDLEGVMVSLLIVGGYITKAEDPRRAAKEFMEAVEDIFG